MNLHITAKKIFQIHIKTIAVLLTLNVIGIVSRYCLNHDVVYGLIPLFDFDTEQNIPTFFSSLMLLLSSGLLALIAAKCRRNKLPHLQWYGLSIIFLFLCVDEFYGIHEQFSNPIKKTLNTPGYLYYAWVIPYSIALILLLSFYLKFLLNLVKKIRLLLILSGVVFVSGAIGFELLAGQQAVKTSGIENILTAFYYTCEESLELIGVAIFIYALLSYIQNQFGYLSISIGNSE